MNNKIFYTTIVRHHPKAGGPGLNRRNVNQSLGYISILGTFVAAVLVIKLPGLAFNRVYYSTGSIDKLDKVNFVTSAKPPPLFRC